MQKILVIENDQEVLRQVREALEASGYCVLTTTDAQEGLRILREESIDIVLVNLLILGTDSLQLFRELHHTRLSTKVIAMTDYIGNWSSQTAASYFGARIFLYKPFNRQKLLEVVGKENKNDVKETAKYCEECRTIFQRKSSSEQSVEQKEFVISWHSSLAGKLVDYNKFRMEMGVCDDCGQLKIVEFYLL